MEDLVLELTRGNPTEVKIVLASVTLGLAVYQLMLIAVGYGRVRPPFLEARPASLAHRASGDVILTLVLVVAVMCIAVFGFEAESAAGAVHVAAACAFLGLLVLKVVLLRLHRGSAALPFLGSGVFVLLGVTWASSAGVMLAA